MKSITYYDFDLDQDAEKRWGPIIDVYSEKLPMFLSNIRSILDCYGSVVSWLKPVEEKYMLYIYFP